MVVCQLQKRSFVTIRSGFDAAAERLQSMT
jgi:hypothetical protein